ncbi:MAG: hypothetical protein KJ583_00805 [Nanoarchaeota archaeon]|nr:hypothetical protein [Nanoarchaeota archaeon]MBU1269357.1 hypothetical protein [Nanoarchaeota archaeon]MBU1603829.1 hypothetical protein [Nanoarchaeota archaeon]MBU2443021.1 hypothetical protein [Nanoarchaeota archaeon]
MSEDKKDIGFFVAIFEESNVYMNVYEPIMEAEIETELIPKGCYFVMDTTKENVENRIKEHLPNNSNAKYIINITPIEEIPNIDGIYDLEKLMKPPIYEF